MCITFILKAKKAFNQKAENLMLLNCWVIRIRTLIDGVRVCDSNHQINTGGLKSNLLESCDPLCLIILPKRTQNGLSLSWSVSGIIPDKDHVWIFDL